MKRIWLPFALASALVAIGCTERTTTARMTDEELESAVRARLQSDADLRERGLDVDADVEKNEVSLSGEVMNQAQRERAIQLANGARPGLVVRDRLEVKQAGMSRAEYTEDMARDAREKAKRTGDKIGDTIDDAWIHTKVVAALIGDSDTPQRKINVDVAQNAVTLRGTVQTEQEKAEAARVAQSVEGVRTVRNLIQVGNS